MGDLPETSPLNSPVVVDLVEEMRTGKSTSARLREVEAERTELLSILARIGDAISPTGERPYEALGTLAADVEELMENLPCCWCGGVGVAPEELFGRDSDGAPMVDGPQSCPEGCEVADWLVAERNDARDTERERDELRKDLTSVHDAWIAADRELTGVRAELASARVELDHLRAERDAAFEAAAVPPNSSPNRG